MHPLYDESVKITEKLSELNLRVVDLSMKLSQIDYDLQVTKAKVERALIKQVGGERKLGPTTDDRERVFTLALDADQNYKELLKNRNEVKYSLEKAKAEILSNRDKLNVIIIAMKFNEIGT